MEKGIIRMLTSVGLSTDNGEKWLNSEERKIGVDLTAQ